jgi:hypothetical protein
MITSIQKVKRIKVTREMYEISKKFEPKVAAAVRKAIQDAQNQISLKAITNALERGDSRAVMNIVAAAKLGERLKGYGLEPGKETFVDNVTGAFKAGATMGARQLPRKIALQATLDLTNPMAVKYLFGNLPALIVEIDKEQMRAVQNALLRGFVDGRDIGLIAREIRDSVGLTTAQSTAVTNFRRQLETGTMGSGTAPWDRRLSAIEQRQARRIYNDPESVSQAKIDLLVTRYQASLVNNRALSISRTEVHRASINGQAELWRQAESQGLIDLDRATRTWIVTHDDRLRADHAAIPDMNPDGVKLNEPFQTPIGPVMRPGESGVAEFDINCRCAEGLEFKDF